MKKLSFIIAIIMILTCMPVVMTAPVAAEEDFTGEGVDIALPANWTTVSQGNSIGFVYDKYDKVYVDTLTHAADLARNNAGKTIVLFLTKDFDAQGLRIGAPNNANTSADYHSDATLNLRKTNAHLVIDGGDQYTFKNTNARFIHFGALDGAEAGQVTFRNMTIDVASGGNMQANVGALEKINLKNVRFNAPDIASTGLIILATDAEIDGVEVDCVGKNFLYCHTNNISATIKNSTINNAQRLVYTADSDVENIVLEGITAANAQYIIFGHSSDNVKNIRLTDLNLTGTTQSILYRIVSDRINIQDLNVENSTSLFISVTADININGGTINTTENIAQSYHGNMVIDGGTFTTSSDHVIQFDAADASTLTINGGTFTSQSATHYVIYQKINDAGKKILTIHGGTFNSWVDDTVEPDETNILEGDTENPEVYGVMYSTADTFKVNGGTFNLYNKTGTALADKGVHALTHGSGRIGINGGTFNGGSYVYVETYTKAFINSKYVEMPNTKKYTMAANSITTTTGASIRTVEGEENAGIRFQGSVGKDVVNYVKELSGGDKNVYCGIAIVPVDYLEQAEAFTFYALEDLDVTGSKWLTKNATASTTGTTTVKLSLTGIQEGNYNRQFAAITYVYGDVNGDGKATSADVVMYSSNQSDPRSVTEVAKAALADVMLVSGTYNKRAYTNKLTTGYYYGVDKGGNLIYVTVPNNVTLYSPFTEAQQKVLKYYA